VWYAEFSDPWTAETAIGFLGTCALSISSCAMQTAVYKSHNYCHIGIDFRSFSDSRTGKLALFLRPVAFLGKCRRSCEGSIKMYLTAVDCEGDGSNELSHDAVDGFGGVSQY
jgi:hypothetical protein